MKPFEIPNAIKSIIDIYPTAEDIVKAINNGEKDVRYILASLWLSEGIPYCFRSQPAIYEEVRLFLSQRLKICAKEITIIGSGRQGFSLSPGENFGRPFGKYSDLDLNAISSPLFEKLKREFERWKVDYTIGDVAPRNEFEKKYWKDNVERIPHNLIRGFIDPYKIPTFDRYPQTQVIVDLTSIIHKKLKITPGAPMVRGVGLRVYSDWDAFVRQMSVNLGVLLKINAI